MDEPSPAMRALARRLLAASQPGVDPHGHGAVLVNENLRSSLTEFAGAEGFASLLRRAVALASAEAPALAGARVRPNGSIEGLQESAGSAAGVGGEEAAAVTAHLLGLLVAFIGDPLTRKLVRQACPEISPDE